MNSNSKSIVEIRIMDSLRYSSVEPFLLSISKDRLPNNISFYVAKGKRWTDIIVYNQSVSINFYSQRMIDVLSAFMDMSRIVYPIQIEGADCKYFTIYNLKEFNFLNQKFTPLPESHPYFEHTGKTPALFTLTNSNLKVCTEEVKNAIEKAKLTNVYFRDVYGLTTEECLVWKQKHMNTHSSILCSTL